MINFVMKNKFAVWIMTIIVVVAGLYSGTTMKMEQMPDINMPLISVTTIYPGATPAEVEEKVTKPIEQAVQNVAGVELVMSSSFQSASAVQIMFDFKQDLDKAQQDVNDALESVRLPEGVDKPTGNTFSLDQIPVLAYGISGKDMDLETLTEIIEKDIVPELEGINGVQSVDIAGQQLQEVHIVFDEAKLAEYGLTSETVGQLIQASTASIPLGVMELGDTEQSVVIDNEIVTLDDLKKLKFLAIPSGMGNDAGAPDMGNPDMDAGAPDMDAGNMPPMPESMPTVELADIATVKLVGKAESIARTNGVESISLSVTKSQTGNAVEVANAVKDKVEAFSKEYGIEFSTMLDMAKPVEDAVSTMLGKALLGALFAVIIIWLFLRNFRSTIIAVVSIPLSLLIAIFLLKQIGYTLNMMTLGAMTVAIGRVIDDSIVVIENIFRRMSDRGEKLSGRDLIREATKQVYIPILSSTIVTIAVFLPLALVGGLVGQIFMPFAMTIVFALLASLLIAVTIVPMMTHMFFKKGVSEKDIHDEGSHSKLALKYRSVLEWSLNRKWIPILISTSLLFGSLALPATNLLAVGFMNENMEREIMLSFTPHPGKKLKDVDEELVEVEKYFLDRKDVESIQVSTGSGGFFDMGNSNVADVIVNYKDDMKGFLKEKETVLKDLEKRDEVGTWGEPDFGGFGAGGNKITKYVYGPDMSSLEETVAEVEKAFEKHADLKDVKSTLKEAYTEHRLVVNQEAAAKAGLSAAQIGMALYDNPQRPAITTVKNDEDEVSVYIEVEKEAFSSIDDITNKMIPSPLGMPVKLGDLVEMETGTTSDTITRRNGKVSVAVEAVPTTKDINKISNDVQKEIDKIKTPAGISIETGGVTADMEEMMTQLGLAMLAAIAIVYLILVITFGGAVKPFVILFSLPLTIIGAFVGLAVTGSMLEMTAMIGLLMLIGIVVTNAIVLVDRVIHNEAKGMTVREALLEAGATRLRPILMTALATIGALFPLALGFDNSGMISKELAITVIGGLTSSTVLTLVIVPIAYELLSGSKRKVKKV